MNPLSRRTGLHHPVVNPCTTQPLDSSQKKADVIEHPKAFDHVGLLCNEPPGKTGVPFI
jgi:hypothetical protein